MRSGFPLGILSLILLASASNLAAQSPAKATAAAEASDAQRGTQLAESGRCKEAMPALKKAVHESMDRDMKKRVGLDGLRCAMTHNVPYESLTFLEFLGREFPRDPEVLYATTHAYSDLSERASRDLMREAPFSYQVHELNAEALEVQGKWDEAAAEYRKILDLNPLLPGIHARLGRVLLSKPNPSPEEVEQAKKNFEDELEIDPRNAGAEYILGELAKDANDLSEAIRHFTRATVLDSGFSEAYLGLGTALVLAKRFADAIPPLEKYEKLAPDSPTGHYQLALAYSGAGRREDANREAALQRETSANLEQVKRKIAEGLLQQQAPAQGADSPQPQPQPQSPQ